MRPPCLILIEAPSSRHVTKVENVTDSMQSLNESSSSGQRSRIRHFILLKLMLFVRNRGQPPFKAPN